MENNRGIVTVIVLFLIILVGYWYVNTPKGQAVSQSVGQSLAANSVAAVYPAYTSTATPAAVYPVTYAPSTYSYSTASVPTAYITYPIASSTSYSSYTAPRTSTSTSTSYSYYATPNQNPYPYQNLPGNCYVTSAGSVTCISSQ